MADTPPIAPTSAQRGYLPSGPGLYRFTFGDANQGFGKGYWPGGAPLEGQSLDNFLQQYVAGITQLDPTLVRPRWQEEPPNIPQNGTDWAAVGVTDIEPFRGWSSRQHDGQNDGRDYQAVQETITLLCSFYGPDADWYDGLLRDGVFVPQNSEVLQLNMMGLVDIGPRRIVPELMNQRYLRRVDRTVRFNRAAQRAYPVLNILSVPFTITAEPPAVNPPNALDHTTSGTVLAPQGSSSEPGRYYEVDPTTGLIIFGPNGKPVVITQS